MLCWGAGDDGQLGDGTFTGRAQPTAVPGEAGVLSLAAGGGHTCVVEGGGSVSCWGRDDFGQLGDGATANQGAPAPVTLSQSESVRATAIAAGPSHTCALAGDGRIFCWGRGDRQQLGGDEMTSLPPSLVVGHAAAIAIASGGDHSCALAGDGHVWCWGANDVGQLGKGQVSPSSAPAEVAGLGDVTAIAAGASHTLCATHRRLGLVLGRQPERPARRWRRPTDEHTAARSPRLPLTTLRR